MFFLLRPMISPNEYCNLPSSRTFQWIICNCLHYFISEIPKLSAITAKLQDALQQMKQENNIPAFILPPPPEFCLTFESQNSQKRAEGANPEEGIPVQEEPLAHSTPAQPAVASRPTSSYSTLQSDCLGYSTIQKTGYVSIKL